MLQGKPFGRLADVGVGLLILALSAMGYLYAANVPGLDPITIWPFWIWAGIFALIGLLLWPLLRRRAALVVAFAVVAGVLLSEEPWFVLRSAWRDPGPAVRAAAADGRLLRVVTLNTEGGDVRAIEDAIDLEPDVILLQESPGASKLRGMVPSDWEPAGFGDSAMLVRGDLHASEHSKYLSHEMYVVRATPARLGRSFTLISTHLVLPSLRTDIWRPVVWRKAEILEQSRRKTIRRLLEQRDRYGEGLPVIIGGDFNTPAGNWLLEPLIANGLTDVFREAGRDWPNTYPSDHPMERIDFIWASEQFDPLDAVAVTTEHSDHRMVYAALAWRKGSGVSEQ
jgi:endonuclease/exonuclease/phosphatase (EEP) superfamily protein YafD